MKKLLKILILILGLTPLLINAKEKEVNYKWYKEVEYNTRYVSDVENVCEYFDKSSYITTDWYYTTVKPEEKEHRVVKETISETSISRFYSKYLEFKYFANGLKIYELEFIDENNNIIDYKMETNFINNNQNTNILNDKQNNQYLTFNSFDVIKLNLEETINNLKMTIRIYHEYNENFKYVHFFTYADNYQNILVNAFAEDEEIMKTKCNNNLCITEFTIKEDGPYIKEPLKIETLIYKYQDKLYKCYDKKIEYAPGYHKDLSTDGYIKDETDFIVIEPTENMCPPVEKTECNCPPVEIPDYNCSTVDIPNTISPIINESDTIQNQEVEDFNETKDEPITENITNKIEHSNELIKDSIAMVTKEKSKDKIPTYMIFITIFCILSIILTIMLIAKKIKKCRMK